MARPALEGHLVTDTLELSSMSSRIRSKDRLDLGLACGLIALGVTGVVMIYSATRQGLINAGDNPHYYLERQAVFVGLGIVVMYVVSLIDYRRLEIVDDAALRLESARVCAGVYVVGSSAQGALRWYSVGIFQIQPSEFTVLILILAIATYCQRRPDGLTMYDVARLLMMSAVPLIFIVLQPDLGTAIIMVLCVGAMLVVAGVPPRLLTLLAVLGSAGRWSPRSTWTSSGVTPLTASPVSCTRTRPVAQWAKYIYNVDNAKNAIGSGGLHGVGLFNGLQTNLGYVPEQHTDFIFTAIGEQVGFIGSMFDPACCSPSWHFGSFASVAWPRTPWAGSSASASSSSSPSAVSRTSA